MGLKLLHQLRRPRRGAPAPRELWQEPEVNHAADIEQQLDALDPIEPLLQKRKPQPGRVGMVTGAEEEKQLPAERAKLRSPGGQLFREVLRFNRLVESVEYEERSTP